MTKVIVAFLVLISCAGVFAQNADEDDITTFLVPISLPDAKAGANGTLWKTELWVHHDLPGGLLLRTCGIAPFCYLSPPPLHPQGTTELAFKHEAESLNGARIILNIDRHSAEKVTLSSRLFELSRNAQPAGIHIPVVREDDFFTKPVRFIGIDGNPGRRVALRIYDPIPLFARDSHGGVLGAPFKVELLGTDGRLLREHTVRVTHPDGRSDEPGFGAVFDLAAAFPELRGVDRYDVRVTPPDIAKTYWAFVSVTDNETQQVTLITAD